MEKMNYSSFFTTPKIIGVVGDVNSGKSNLLSCFFLQLQKCNCKIYFFSCPFSASSSASSFASSSASSASSASSSASSEIFCLSELENISNSVVFIDEFINLFDVDDRKKKQEIERTLRLVHHKNNIIILCGLPENFKKFLSAKIDIIFFMKSSLDDFINGSKIAKIIKKYSGIEKGTEILNLEKNESLLFDGSHFQKIKVPYIKKYDTKRKNKNIIW